MQEIVLKILNHFLSYAIKIVMNMNFESCSKDQELKISNDFVNKLFWEFFVKTDCFFIRFFTLKIRVSNQNIFICM